MKKSIKYTLLALVAFTTLSSCFKDNDDVFAGKSEVNNFIYRGMNAFYLYKADVDVLADDRFANQGELEAFHDQFDSPETFFESLVFDRPRTDRFSVIFSDYVALENILSGNTLNNGMEFGLVGETGSSTDVYGYVRYVHPNTSAATENVQRGMIFNSINGIRLSRTNVATLLAQNTYTIGLASLSAGVTTSNGNEITLTKAVIQENPILVSQVIDQGTQKVGYLMYNSFLSQFDEQLNGVFADFRAQGVTHLVLDLRYNGGGSVNSAIILGSLISGNPVTDVYSTEEWNPDVQAQLQASNPDQLINLFRNQTGAGSTLNTLNLSQVHIITTGNSASASELVINSLDPYINVVQVGDDTAGKFQASTTLYDSANFARSGANPAHRYAMQPLILKSLNSVGNTDYFDGLAPDIAQGEDFENLGILGDINEPLLARCLDDIMLNGRASRQSFPTTTYEEIMGSNELKPFGNEMWKEISNN
ncbi:C-terminal processing protease CtpA/Prc [Nonlabens xylanidelens]|uniref:C-terminal processing protease CtpA/Prc n=1 Tax=Nonlabens xylanidelens TaxID=191564 RepID=A0A2S6IID7_9FLAO|nr:S41 family peptidase [Nonlabens xylanidelens]PPK93951.1 C-terminal processing protease CtpA/Prc [Nonlabens xylanidelens]PQJ22107.1 peptidase S41 [Nonlabens xylanidelens]